jgi:hypothetical protein
MTWVPPACTLPTTEQPLRVAEFDSLFARSVRGLARPGRRRLTLTLEPTPEVAATTAGLVMKETGCCSFFTFTLTAANGRLELDVETDHEDVLDAIERLAS